MKVELFKAHLNLLYPGGRVELEVLEVGLGELRFDAVQFGPAALRGLLGRRKSNGQ